MGVRERAEDGRFIDGFGSRESDLQIALSGVCRENREGESAMVGTVYESLKQDWNAVAEKLDVRGVR
jgi:hypothetical protein